MDYSNQTMKALRNQLDNEFGTESFQALLKEHGITIKLGSCRYESDRATFKLIVENVGALSQEEKDLPQMAQIHQFDIDKIGFHNGARYKLVGYKRKARKSPWIVRNLNDNKDYVINDFFAATMFKVVLEDKVEGVENG